MTPFQTLNKSLILKVSVYSLLTKEADLYAKFSEEDVNNIWRNFAGDIFDMCEVQLIRSINDVILKESEDI